MEPKPANPPRLISRRSLLGGTLAAGGLLLAGCGSDSGTTPGSTETPTGGASTGTATATETAAARIDNLRLGVPTDILPNGILRFTPGNRPIRRTVFDVVIDKARDGSYVPALADSWEWNGDRTQLVIKLRDGITYHSGRAFTADDVLFLVGKAMEDGSGAQVAQLLARGDMTKTGDLELTVAFDKPFASYLDAFCALPVVDSETFDGLADGKQVVGTGPFTWGSWTPGSQFDLQRFDSYWGGDVKVDQVSVSIITEAQAMLAAMRSGDLDLTERMVARDAATLEKSGFSVARSVGYDYYVGANTSVAPLDDVRVRQAIAYALDRDRIVSQVFSGFAEASSIPWSSDTPGVTDAQVHHYTYDIDKAKSLIQEAGAEGAEVPITPSPQDPTYGAVADIVQFGLTEIGLKPRTATVDAAEFPAHMQAGEFEGLWVAIVGLTSLGPTTSLMTANPFRADANSHNFTPPEWKSLHEGVVEAPDTDAQASALSELTDYMLDQAFHNTVVQASTTVVGAAELTGVDMDLTLALKLTDTARST